MSEQTDIFYVNQYRRNDEGIWLDDRERVDPNESRNEAMKWVRVTDYDVRIIQRTERVVEVLRSNEVTATEERKVVG